MRLIGNRCNKRSSGLVVVTLVAFHVSTVDLSLARAGRPRGGLLGRLLEAESRLGTVCPSADAGQAVEARIEALAEKVRPLLDGATSKRSGPDEGSVAARRVEILNHLVFGDLAIRPTQDLKDPANLLLACILELREGYCVGIASLYLVLAERLGLPVHAVATPSHVFLRYDDGLTRINIETFQRGAHVADEEYIRDHRIPEKPIRRGIFMSTLTTEEFLAQVHNNLGVIYSEMREYGKATEQYDRAIDLHPEFPAAFYNHGNDLLARGEYRKALRRFSMALRLYPTDVWALNNRGLARAEMGEVGGARRDFEAALRIDAGFGAARANLARLSEGRDAVREP